MFGWHAPPGQSASLVQGCPGFGPGISLYTHPFEAVTAVLPVVRFLSVTGNGAKKLPGADRRAIEPFVGSPVAGVVAVGVDRAGFTDAVHPADPTRAGNTRRRGASGQAQRTRLAPRHDMDARRKRNRHGQLARAGNDAAESVLLDDVDDAGAHRTNDREGGAKEAVGIEPARTNGPTAVRVRAAGCGSLRAELLSWPGLT